MSKSFLNPKIETSFVEGAKTAQRYFADNFNDNSFMVIKAIPNGVYNCFTEDNPTENYYFKYVKE